MNKKGYSFYISQRKKYGDWYSGDFKSWKDADQECMGYDLANIPLRTLDSITKTINSNTSYERDGAIISYNNKECRPDGQDQLINYISKLGDDPKILDFGGSLGSTYFQIKNFIKKKSIEWHILEQPFYKNLGERYLQKFFPNIHFHDNLKTNYKFDLLCINGVLSYLEDPYCELKKMLSLGIPKVFIDRQQVIVDSESDRIVIQVVPPEIYSTIYVCTFLGEKKLNKTMEDHGYFLSNDFLALGTKVPEINNGYYKGFIYEKK